MTMWIGEIQDEHTMRKLGFYDGEVTSYIRADGEDMTEFFAEFSNEEIERFREAFDDDDDSDREIAEIFSGQNDDYQREKHLIWHTYRPVYDIPNWRLYIEIWDNGTAEIWISEFDPTTSLESIEFSYEEISHNEELCEMVDLSLEIFIDYGVLLREVSVEN